MNGNYTPEAWKVWQFSDHEADLAVGPEAGGVAVCEVITSNAHGIRTPETVARGRFNARVIAAAPEMLRILRHVAQVLDMSDSTHPNFRDSCADCVEVLWMNETALRLLLLDLDKPDQDRPDQDQPTCPRCAAGMRRRGSALIVTINLFRETAGSLTSPIRPGRARRTRPDP